MGETKVCDRKTRVIREQGGYPRDLTDIGTSPHVGRTINPGQYFVVCFTGEFRSFGAGHWAIRIQIPVREASAWFGSPPRPRWRASGWPTKRDKCRIGPDSEEETRSSPGSFRTTEAHEILLLKWGVPKGESDLLRSMDSADQRPAPRRASVPVNAWLHGAQSFVQALVGGPFTKWELPLSRIMHAVAGLPRDPTGLNLVGQPHSLRLRHLMHGLWRIECHPLPLFEVACPSFPKRAGAMRSGSHQK